MKSRLNLSLIHISKYIYPISRLCYSLINLGMALLPLFIVMMFTGTAFGPSLLLLIFDILCMLGFVMGMMLLLSTAMTFFQDTQFLWSVVSMMWMYPVSYTHLDVYTRQTGAGQRRLVYMLIAGFSTASGA